jgi:hypothetical protein
MAISTIGTNSLSDPIAVNGYTPTASNMQPFNRIINGAMVISQYNGTSSVTPTVNGTYVMDRWRTYFSVASKYSVQQNAGSVTPPVGFTNYLGVTSLSAYSVGASEIFGIQQFIEGFNTADLAWGTANAQSVTLSFKVYSSLTGTFGGVLQNDGQNRSYPFTYTISSANTWTTISITVAGDTSGTWLTNNGRGVTVWFNLGTGSTLSGTAGAWAAAGYYSATGATSVVGTSGATFYITGVQLEAGSTASSFDYRPYGTELVLCQRYYYKVVADTTSSFFSDGQCDQTTSTKATIPFKVTMRTTPTALEQSGTAGDYRVNHSGTTTTCSSVPTFAVASSNAAGVVFTVASGLTVGRACALQTTSATAFLAWSAEL